MNSTYTGSRLKKKLTGLWRRNAVLAMGMGLVPAIAGSVTLRGALAVSFVMAIVVIPTYLLASLIKFDRSLYIRIPIYAIIAAVFFIPAIIGAYSIFTISLRETVGIYLYLTVVDVMVIFRADEYARKNRLLPALVDALVNVVGFTLVICIAAIVREFLAFNTFFGIKLPVNFTITAASLPLFGFIVIGMLAAAVNAINNRVDRARAEQAMLDAYERERAGQEYIPTVRKKKRSYTGEKLEKPEKEKKPPREKREKKEKPPRKERSFRLGRKKEDEAETPSANALEAAGETESAESGAGKEE